MEKFDSSPAPQQRVIGKHDDDDDCKLSYLRKKIKKIYLFIHGQRHKTIIKYYLIK